MANEATRAGEVESVPCPFCALLCDDLRVIARTDGIEVTGNGCDRSRRFFSRSGSVPSPAISGKTVDLEAALDRASTILRSARHPRFVSAGADVAGIRVMLAIADRMKGSFDHIDSLKAGANLRVLQDAGWVATTLSEVRNRADLLVLAGVDVAGRYPRFLERCFGQGTSMFGTDTREIWSLGNPPSGGTMPGRHLASDNFRLAEVFSAMNALLANRRVEAQSVAGIGIRDLDALVARMKLARYGVLAWSAADFDFPHAELTVQSMAALVRALNAGTRFSMLPLAGPRADATASQVTTWQTGTPLGVDFRRGSPKPHGSDLADPFDAVVYVAPLGTGDAPGGIRTPLVVLGDGAAASWESDVFIPVATPGVHATGHYYRTDGVVCHSMKKLVDRGLPTAAQVLERIAASPGVQA